LDAPFSVIISALMRDLGKNLATICQVHSPGPRAFHKAHERIQALTTFVSIAYKKTLPSDRSKKSWQGTLDVACHLELPFLGHIAAHKTTCRYIGFETFEDFGIPSVVSEILHEWSRDP
jgi:hypothetical protein